ncbi:MAG: hypothetical protein FJ288_15895 [Planctomycetes bacterium]|nr:hypothetical protein [Planctomycetota bacterium]
MHIRLRALHPLDLLMTAALGAAPSAAAVSWELDRRAAAAVVRRALAGPVRAGPKARRRRPVAAPAAVAVA